MDSRLSTKQKIGVFGIILLLVVSFFYLNGNPTMIYYTLFEHNGSKAYEGRSTSILDNNDHHVRVCDHTPFYYEHAVVDVKGSNIVVYDNNGMRDGCGNKTFSKNGRGHKTCSRLNCGAWSRHYD